MEIKWENIDELEDYQITYLLYKESLNVNQIAKVRNMSPQEIADHLIKVQIEKREEERKKDSLEIYLTFNKEERLEFLEGMDSDEIMYFTRKMLRLIPIEKDIRNIMILAWTAGELADDEFLEFLEELINHENDDVRKVANSAIKKIKNKSKEADKNKKEKKLEENIPINLNEKNFDNNNEKKDELQSFLGLDKNKRLDFLDRLKPEKMIYFKRKVYKRILTEYNTDDLIVLIWTTGELKDENFLKILHNLTEHRNSDVRRITYSAIRKIGSPKSREVLELGLLDSNPQTRQYCAKALLKVGNRHSLNILRNLYRARQGVEKDYVLRAYREAIIELEKSV
ncbi:HEAT repeat domain-containing protein [Peptacetobacter hiranonis]|uniref:HEAT repeat domain-containing protein n=1 Tax=Peptacetobacter hiranonis TaxID=89152 RepID=UPI002E78F5EF|nr:HEAT repeat domain-containing protein [Peptacetobacter hiranonis]MEE0249193.1 HEAT repeat domain-containing protein [Peptacetobacter hiranonis]